MIIKGNSWFLFSYDMDINSHYLSWKLSVSEKECNVAIIPDFTMAMVLAALISGPGMK